MRSMVPAICALAAAAALAASAQSAMAATNLIQNGVASTSIIGVQGTLHNGTWNNALKTASDPATVYDGVFQPETTQWNHNSFWWDQAAQPDSTKQVSLTLNLKHTDMFTSLVMQADDNDTYQVDYWNGSSWVDAWDVPKAGSFGLITRDSPAVSFETDKLRLIATGGDGYYGISELQGFGAEVPEPATWAMMLFGVAAIGAGMRMQRKVALEA